MLAPDVRREWGCSPFSRNLDALTHSLSRAHSRSAEDAGYLYYPSDEEIPVKLCKYLYGYPRDFDEHYQMLEELGKGKSAPLALPSSPASAVAASEAALSDSSERSSS